MNKRQQQSEIRHQRILQAASHRFARFGYQSASMDDIARDAGVSKGLIYCFYKNKQALYEATLRRELSQWLEESAHIAPHKNDPVADLQSLICAPFDILRNKPVLQTLLTGDTETLTRYQPLFRRLRRRWRNRIMAILKDGIAHNVFDREMDTVHTAGIIYTLQRSYLDRAVINTNNKMPAPEAVLALSEFVVKAVVKNQNVIDVKSGGSQGLIEDAGW